MPEFEFPGASERTGGGGGGKAKRKKWVMIAVGTGIIAIFLVLRNSMKASQAAQTAGTNVPAPMPAVADTGGYPDMTGGIGGMSGTGMDQTLATYLAVADQNTSVQMGALNNQLTSIQDQFKTQNEALGAQIAAINAQSAGGTTAATPAQPVTTTTPATTAHPDPTSYSHVIQKGESLYKLAVAQYGSPHAAMAGGIQKIAAANPGIIKDPAKIYAGQTIVIPTKM